MYTAKVTANCGGFKSTIGVFKDDIQIGEFTRNYDSFGVSTFVPFERDGKWYALYSPSYVALSVMSLPDCVHIGGENQENSGGFCPVEVHIPTYQVQKIYAITGEKLNDYPEQNRSWLAKDRYTKEYDKSCWGHKSDRSITAQPIFYENFAFISGCVWGDDSSMKVEIRDISKAHLGIIERVDWGYLELPGMKLEDCINLSPFGFDPTDPNQREAINVNVTITKTKRIIRENSKFTIEHFE